MCTCAHISKQGQTARDGRCCCCGQLEQPAAATAAGAAKAKSSRGGERADQLSALCSLPTTHGLTAHKHMCVNSKYEYNNYNNEYNNNNNNELLAWR